MMRSHGTGAGERLFGERLPYFDAHCDTLSRCLQTGESLLQTAGQCDLNRLAAYSPCGQVFAMFHDSADVPPEGLFGRLRRMYALFCRERAAHPEKLGGAALSIEGGELLECSLRRLEEIGDWDVRAINLTWNHANALSGSHREEPERGLSPAGRAFVRKAQAMGILLDVSHLSDPGFWDLADMTELPLFASHSNSRAVCGHTRNLTDDQFRAIRDSGGVVGINLFNAFVGGDSMEHLLAHFDHFLELGGEKTLALGSDWDGGIVGAGGIRGVEDMHLLAEAMAGHGYGKDLIWDIFYNNLARLLSPAGGQE